MERQGTVCIGLDDQTEYALGKDEILSHLNSMCEMTRVGKIHWTLCSYDYPHFFVSNPFVHDIEADISHCFLVEGNAQGRRLSYAIREAIKLPSGLCDVEIEEKIPDTEYAMSLSLERDYEYLILQKQVLERYGAHPAVVFAKLVMGQIKAMDFKGAIRVDEKNRKFSFEPIPSELADLPLLQKAWEMYNRCDAAAFHSLVFSNDLRKGLGIKDI